MNMKKLIVFLCLAMIGHSAAYSQFYTTRTGFIGFYSKTPLEDIKAENNQVYAVIDAGKKNIAFSLLVKGFVFAKELMQVHFNENYVESDKYPRLPSPDRSRVIYTSIRMASILSRSRAA